jgi:signal transduction histidine kinase
MKGIHSLPIFADATVDELQWLIDNSREVALARGEYIFREGDPARLFYVVIEGELQVTRTINGEPTVVGTTPRGIIGGELFLLNGTEVRATAQAIVPSRLMVFDLPAFLAIFTRCPTVGVKILRVAAERMHDFASLVKQQEKMAALGKLAAGLAHELNNPAAAAQRATGSLRSVLPSLQAHTIRLNGLGLTGSELERLIQFLAEAQARAAERVPLSTLAQGEREDEMGEWLEARAVQNSWDMAAIFVGEQVTVTDLSALLDDVATAQPGELLTWLCEALNATSLLGEIEQSTRRISELVGAIKAYTYMDRGVLQEVDVHKDLENTLLVLKHRLKNIEVVRDYDPELPHLTAHGGELNQVWTNLIANAADALQDTGAIQLITRCENNFIMVEVADNGPGIPADIQARIFEPFYTTKEVGAGTGLGLDITYRIVQQHNGSIEVQSQPGRTRFIVRLPVSGLSA